MNLLSAFALAAIAALGLPYELPGPNPNGICSPRMLFHDRTRVSRSKPLAGGRRLPVVRK